MNDYEIEGLAVKPDCSTRKQQGSNENLVSESPLKSMKSETEDESNQIALPFPDGPVSIPILCDGFKFYYFPCEGYPPNTVLKMEKPNGEKDVKEELKVFLCDVCLRPAPRISLALLHMQLSHRKYYEGYEEKKV